jgi:hypothetical protein
MSFNGIGNFSIEAGETLPLDGWSFPNGEDMGAQYFSANPTFDTAGFELVISGQNKTRHPDGTVSYGFNVTNTDPGSTFPIFFNVQGGGFQNGFNNIGRFTIAANEILNLDGWSFPNGSDQGAQYFAANPISNTGSMLVMSNQNKTRNPNGSVDYGFTIQNTDPNNDVVFNVDGGGFVNGFNGVGQFTVNPGDTLPLDGWSFGNGDDHGAQYFSANPTSQAGSTLVMSQENKTRGLNGNVTYGFTVENTDPEFPVFFDVQGGGFI